MSSIRFLYKSKYKPDSVVTKNSEKPVKSGAVYDALQNIHANALFETGYFSDGIVGYAKKHILTYANNSITVAKESVLYCPMGRDTAGNMVFESYTVEKDITATGGVNTYNTEFFVDTTNAALVGNIVHTLATNNIDVIQKVFAQDTDPYESYKDAGYDGHIWWDTKNNYIKLFVGGTKSWKTVKYTLPVGIVSCDGVKIAGIVNDFLTCGYIDNYAFVNPGVIMLVPHERGNNNQSTYVVDMITTDNVLTKKMFDTNAEAGSNFDDYKMYVTVKTDATGSVVADSLEGAEGNLAIDRVKGCYTNSSGEILYCCPVATLSTKGCKTTELTEGEEVQTAPYIVSSFSPRLPITIADKDDIDYVVKLLGSTHGLTIDMLEEEIRELEDNLTDKINADVKAVDDKFVNYVKNTGDETIAGAKTFSTAINAELNGKAARVNTTQISTASDPEIIPVGINVNAQSDVDKSTLYAQTTVKIGYNKVTAESFEGRATSMRWADLAEIYEADCDYEPGTLVMFGGEKEITLANGKANAVVSDKPAVLMNSGAKGLPIAMMGRVKVRVLGPCKKFDNIVIHENVTGVGMAQKEGGIVIGKALEDKEFAGEGLVLCVVQLNLQ